MIEGKILAVLIVPLLGTLLSALWYRQSYILFSNTRLRLDAIRFLCTSYITWKSFVRLPRTIRFLVNKAEIVFKQILCIRFTAAAPSGTIINLYLLVRLPVSKDAL